jgi:uracil phosphoribosyltransferase
MKNLTIIDHPLIKRDLTVLRDRRTNNHLFRTTLRRIASVMAFHVTHDLKLRRITVRTPLENTRGYLLADDIVIVPVLRAGLGLVEGFLDFLPEARVGHVGLYRNEQTLQPVDYYSKFPRSLGGSLVLLLDPMLATGGTAQLPRVHSPRSGGRGGPHFRHRLTDDPGRVGKSRRPSGVTKRLLVLIQ